MSHDDTQSTDDWWVRLVYEDSTPVPEIRADHMSKRHISLARHLADDHGIRFDRQVPLDGCNAQHNECHVTTNANLVPHPHGSAPFVLASHLADEHGIRLKPWKVRQKSLDRLVAQHNDAHATTNAWLVPHPHETVGT